MRATGDKVFIAVAKNDEEGKSVWSIPVVFDNIDAAEAGVELMKRQPRYKTTEFNVLAREVNESTKQAGLR